MGLVARLLARPRLLDAAVVVLVALPVIVSSTANAADDDRALLGLLAGIGASAPLFWRRDRPLTALAAVLAVAAVAPVAVTFELPALILVFTVATRRSWPIGLAAAAAVGATALLVSATGPREMSGVALAGIAQMALAAAGAGIYVGGRRARIAALSERAARLQRERVLLAQRAVAEERLRIAQELHDVVAHNVSLMVVQAQALGATASDPDVRAGTDAVAQLGRDTMTEMHRTLKLLRGDDASDANRSPQPGLAELGNLLEGARSAGLPVALAVEGEPRELSRAIDLSAYRIIQEAVTNVVKHAGPVATTVTLVYRDDSLELTVVNEPGPSARRPETNGAGGHGLVGMRERAAMFGGAVTAGPTDEGGFRVHAVLPEEPA